MGIISLAQGTRVKYTGMTKISSMKIAVNYQYHLVFESQNLRSTSVVVWAVLARVCPIECD